MIVLGLDFLHAVAREAGEEVALGQLDALDEGLERRARRLALLGRDALHRATQIVGEGQHVAGEVRDAIELGVADFLLGAATQVLHVGERAQHLVLERGVLGVEILQLVERLGRIDGRLRRALGSHRAGGHIARGVLVLRGTGRRIVLEGFFRIGHGRSDRLRFVRPISGPQRRKSSWRRFGVGPASVRAPPLPRREALEQGALDRPLP